MMKEAMTSFHGDDVTPSPPDKALFYVIPVPFERTVSYGQGTNLGPAAILEASTQLELLTDGVVPAEHGIYTAAPVDCDGLTESILAQVAAEVSIALQHDCIPVLLGGEHTISRGAVDALQHKYKEFGIVHFDAHADLRYRYEESPDSHACVMRRIHETGVPIYQVGTRSYSLEEQEYRQRHQIGFTDSVTIWKEGINLRLPDSFPDNVYLSFDIDVFDSSVLPATGTPVPGGLNWYQVMWLLERVMGKRTCIGFDVVEFAPQEHMHACSFAAAQLVYNIMALCLPK